MFSPPTTITKGEAVQRLKEVKTEIECTNQLTAAGMVKVIEALQYLVEVSRGN